MHDSTRRVPEALQLSEFLRIVKGRKLLVFGVVLTCVLAAVAVTSLMPRWYEAVATLRVEKPESDVALFRAKGPSPFDANFVASQVEILRESEKIHGVVADRLDLDRRIARMIGYPGSLPRTDTLRILRRDMLKVEVRPRTDSIDIRVSAKDGAEPSAPALAAEIANAIAREYEQDRLDFATSDQTAAIEKLREELVRQEGIVREQRDEVERLRRQYDISGVDLATRQTQSEVETLRQMERTLSALKVDAMARKTRFERIREIPLDERIRVINAELIPDRNIQDLLQAYLLAEQTVARLEQRLGGAHPDLVAARENHARLRSQLDALLSGYEKSLEIAWQEAQSRVDAMVEQLDIARSQQIESANSRFRPFEESMKRLEDSEYLLRSMRNSLRQREVDFKVPARASELLQAATPPVRPSRPNWPLNVALSLVLGGLLAVATAYLMEFVDTSFRSVEDIERKLGLPVLGVVGRNSELVGPANYNAPQAEPYRVIQTNIELARRQGDAQVLAVQSAGPGEGKSTTLHNLAAVMGIAGLRVLIVDSDLRRPSQHTLFRIPRGVGLTEVLQGTLPLDEALRPSGLPNVSLMCSGVHPSSALSLLHGPRLAEVVAELRKRFDKVLLDSPPAIGISDSAVLARQADAVIFVLEHRRNPQSMTQRACQVIQSVGGRLLGVVLNRVPSGGDADYNYYTSNYHYYRDIEAAEAPSADNPKPPTLPQGQPGGMRGRASL